MTRRLIATFLALAAATAIGGVPQPCIVVHGLVRDPYGFPYIDDASVVLRGGAVECSRAAIRGILAGGINYCAELDVDSGGPRYADYAVQTGDILNPAVEIGGQPQPLVTSNPLVVGRCGSQVRLDLQVGSDADGDGLPDAWELELVAQSRGRLAGIEDVRPEDDFDEDGFTNLQELLAGTFAFLATDVLRVESVESAAGGRLKLRFLTSANVTYRVIATPGLTGGSWLPVPFAITTDGQLGYQDLVGDGAYRTVYVDGSQPVLFLRLATR